MKQCNAHLSALPSTRCVKRFGHWSRNHRTAVGSTWRRWPSSGSVRYTDARRVFDGNRSPRRDK